MTAERTGHQRPGRQGAPPALPAALATAAAGATLRPTFLGGHHAVTAGAPEAAEVEAPPPAADLELIGSIGRGGMGWVRLARQRALGREVAVKTLLPARRDPGSVAALLHEARVAGRLEHPNIVPVHALGWQEPDGPLLIMKKVEGTVWRALIADPRRPPWQDEAGQPLERHLRVLLEVAQAVHFAHARGVLHGDIKPDNVMIGAFGEVYLLDWGVARALDGLRTDQLVGTPAFMAPELATPGAAVDQRADVYLMGATLYAVLTGGPPHAGASAAEAIARAAGAAAPPPLPDHVPGELAAICRRACAPDPADRYPDAAAFRRAIAEFLGHQGSMEAAALAAERLAALEALLDAPEVDRAVALRRADEARFGYEQALRSWPENPAARAGMARCVLRTVDLALAGGDVNTAAALAASLDPPDPAVEARIAEARAAQAERAEAADTLARLQRDARLHGAGFGRSLVTVLNGFIVAGVLVAAGAWVRRNGGEVTPGQNLLFMTGCALATGLGILPFRRFLLDTAIYGRLMIVLACVGPLLLINRAFGVLVDAPFAHTLAADCALLTGLCAGVAATITPAFWVSTGWAIVVSVIALTHLRYAPDLIGLGYLAHGIYLGWTLRPR